MMTTVQLTANYAEFLNKQSFLSSGDRSQYSKMDMLKFISGGKGHLVAHISATDPQFEGNPFAVADYLMSESKERESRAKEGADRTKAINKAKGSANIDSTTAGAPSADAESNHAYADSIAPNTIRTA